MNLRRRARGHLVDGRGDALIRILRDRAHRDLVRRRIRYPARGRLTRSRQDHVRPARGLRRRLQVGGPRNPVLPPPALRALGRPISDL